MISYTLTLVAFVVSIRMLSVLISVVFGYYVFKERIKEKFSAAAIMILGVLFITLS